MRGGDGGRGWVRESSRCEDQITTRPAASLRPSGNGRIGFKPPYSKRETAAPVWVQSFMEAFPFLRVKSF